MEAAREPAQPLKILADQSLPLPSWQSPEGLDFPLQKASPAYGKDFLRRATDVRWQDDTHVLIAAIRDGTLRVSVAPSELSPLKRAFGPLENAGVYGSHAMLGSSQKFLAAASVGHIVSWMPIAGPEPKPIAIDTDFNTLIDLDVWGDRILVLGLQRLEGKRIAADGAIAWTGRLGPKLEGLRPVQFSISGPGARDTDACAPMMMGKVRYLPLGGFVVAPGGEPGVFVHTPQGELQRAWDADEIGFDAGCPISEDEMTRYSVDDDARFRWMNARRILDEILPLREGVGFVIRTRDQGMTRWTLKVMSPEGKITSYLIPFTSPSEFARVSGDVRGDRIVFLVGSESDSLPPPGSLRLIVTEAPGTAAPAPKPASAKKGAALRKTLPPKKPPRP